MSTENKEVKPNEKPADAGTKPAAEDKKEDNKESTDKKEDNEADKKKQRLERFGMSTEEDLNKRKERFKDQIKEIEEEKEKAKGERGRIRRNNNYKNNNYRNSRDGRRTHRDFRRGGGKFHDRRIRGDRRNNSYKK